MCGTSGVKHVALISLTFLALMYRQTGAQVFPSCSSHALGDQVSPNITDGKAGSGVSRGNTFVQLQGN